MSHVHAAAIRFLSVGFLMSTTSGTSSPPAAESIPEQTRKVFPKRKKRLPGSSLNDICKMAFATQEFFYDTVPASDYNVGLFQDHERMASLMVSHDAKGLHVNGIIGEDMRIKPQMERSSEGHVPHVLYQEEPLNIQRRVMGYVALPLDTFTHLVAVERASIVLEVHLVIDTTYFEGYNSSQAEIIKYLGVVMNAVALRYETITLLNVRIKIVGFTFNDKPEMEAFFVALHEQQELIADQETLAAFNGHMARTHGALYARADAVFLITGRNLAYDNKGRIDASVRGLAYIGGACSTFRAAVCEDVPWSFNVVRTLAHEAAHTLGCVHDGDEAGKWLLRDGPHPGAISCPWKSGFLMSYVRKDNNQFRFSACCQRQIRYLSRLKSRACLSKESSKNALHKAPKQLPGSMTPLNAICRKALGANFSYDSTRPLSGCTVKCSTKPYVALKEGKRFTHWKAGNAKAMDGSPCDSKDPTKVCIGGDCVPGKEFPSNVIPKPRKVSP